MSQVNETFVGAVDADSPLQAAAREAGWALMQLVDAVDWSKRNHLTEIIMRLTLALNTPAPASTAMDYRNLLWRYMDHVGSIEGSDFTGRLEQNENFTADEMAELRSMAQAPEAPTPSSNVNGEPVRLTYTNWRGETSERTIKPRYVWFGSTEWHPEPQWLLTAFDLEKNADRDFALKDFGCLPPPSTNVDACIDDLEKQVKDLKHDLAEALHNAKNATSNLEYWRGQYESRDQTPQPRATP